jgi:hypothetical protein
MSATQNTEAPTVIVTSLLNTLAVLYDRRRMATIAIDDQIAALQARRIELTGPLDTQIAEAEALVKANVLEIGVTIKAGDYTAVYAKGRTSWDARLLDGYAAAHPEILPFRHVGAPSVSIRPARRDSDG